MPLPLGGKWWPEEPSAVFHSSIGGVWGCTAVPGSEQPGAVCLAELAKAKQGQARKDYNRASDSLSMVLAGPREPRAGAVSELRSCL